MYIQYYIFLFLKNNYLLKLYELSIYYNYFQIPVFLNSYWRILQKIKSNYQGIPRIPLLNRNSEISEF